MSAKDYYSSDSCVDQTQKKWRLHNIGYDSFEDEMGWEPQYPDLESIITSTWNWHQKYPDGYTVD